MVAEVISTVFGGIWKIMVGVEVPGLGVSIAAFSVALLLMRFSIFLFHFISGLGGMSAGDYGRGANLADRAKSSYAWNNGRKIGFDGDY